MMYHYPHYYCGCPGCPGRTNTGMSWTQTFTLPYVPKHRKPGPAQ